MSIITESNIDNYKVVNGDGVDASIINDTVETAVNAYSNSQTAISSSNQAVNTANLAEEKIDEFIKTEGNSVVTLNGVPQVTWSADFVEAERQKSKNLLNLRQNYSELYGVSYTYNEPVLSVTTLDEYPYNYVFFPLKIEIGKTYTVSFHCDNFGRVAIYNKQLTKQYANIDKSGYGSFMFTPSEVAEYTIGFYGRQGEGTFNYSNIQVEEGSVATEYQPYHGQITHNGDAPVVFAESERQKSKNLCCFKDAVANYDGLTVSTNSKEQTITINGTTGGSGGDWMAGISNLIPRVENYAGKTITLSAKVISGSRNGTIMFCLCPSNEPWYTGWEGTSFNLSADEISGVRTANITTNKSLDSIRIFTPGGNTFNELVIQLQIEEGDKATDWQFPYGAIVHEKDVRGVEQLETIYDKTSNDSTINKGYTSGIQFGVNVSFPGMQSKYKGWYFTFHIYGADIRMYTPNIDIGHNSIINRIVFAAANQGIGAAIAYGGLNIVYDGITASGCKYFHTELQTITNVANNSNYYISKIEGVLL